MTNGDNFFPFTRYKTYQNLAKAIQFRLLSRIDDFYDECSPSIYSFPFFSSPLQFMIQLICKSEIKKSMLLFLCDCRSEYRVVIHCEMKRVAGGCNMHSKWLLMAPAIFDWNKIYVYYNIFGYTHVQTYIRKGTISLLLRASSCFVCVREGHYGVSQNYL